MNNSFDAVTKSVAQSVTHRAALKKFGFGLGSIALACFGLPSKAKAATRQGYSEIHVWGYYTNSCIDPAACVSSYSADCPSVGTLVKRTDRVVVVCLAGAAATNRRCKFA